MAGSFRFRLEKALDWYSRQCQLEETRLAACLAALAGADQAIARHQAEHLAIERDMVSRTSIPSREFVALGLYRLRAKRRALELNADRERSQAAVQEQRTRAQAARRRVRLVEKLRERRLSEWEYGEARELENLAADAFFAKWAARE